jgi:hypothetical protein
VQHVDGADHQRRADLIGVRLALAGCRVVEAREQRVKQCAHLKTNETYQTQRVAPRAGGVQKKNGAVSWTDASEIPPWWHLELAVCRRTMELSVGPTLVRYPRGGTSSWRCAPPLSHAPWRRAQARSAYLQRLAEAHAVREDAPLPGVALVHVRRTEHHVLPHEPHTVHLRRVRRDAGLNGPASSTANPARGCAGLDATGGARAQAGVVW